MRFAKILLCLFVLLLWTAPARSQSACTHYASPSGGGSGLTQASPFQISSFWSVGSLPGKVLCLLNGTYTGANSMINPTSGINGTNGNPITVRALNDGQAELDGQGVRYPVLLVNNDWFVLEGFNAHAGSADVVRLGTGTANNIVRRVVAWDAGDINAMVFSTNGAANLFEDVAGFGVARKTFSFADSTVGGNICRRCWGRWEGSTNVGPKDTFELVYNSLNNTFENVIGTWDGGSMPSTYTLQNNGTVWAGGGAGVYTNKDVNQPYGVIAESDGAVPTFGAGVFGSLAYVKTGDKFQANAVVAFEQGGGGYTFKDVASHLAGHSGQKAVSLLNGGSGLVVDKLTGVSTTADTIQGGWTSSNVEHGTTIGGVSSIWTGGSAAQVCFRYVNETLTAVPLWPWPMNSRILAATTTASSGDHTHYIYQGGGPALTSVNDPHAAVDVTAEIEAIFGAIPSGCRTGGTSGGGTPELVASWDFEEGAGPSVADGSGKGNTGTISGATWTTGLQGNGLSFDGVNDKVTVSNSASLQLTDGMTLIASVNPSSISGWQAIMALDYAYYLYASSTGYCASNAVLGGINPSGNACYGTALSTSTWTRVGLTFNAATLWLYINGVPITSQPAGLIPISSGDLTIGASPFGEYFAGKMDKVRIYNYALNAAAMLADFVASQPDGQPVGPSAVQIGTGAGALKAGTGS